MGVRYHAGVVLDGEGVGVGVWEQVDEPEALWANNMMIAMIMMMRMIMMMIIMIVMMMIIMIIIMILILMMILIILMIMMMAHFALCWSVIQPSVALAMSG